MIDRTAYIFDIPHDRMRSLTQPGRRMRRRFRYRRPTLVNNSSCISAIVSTLLAISLSSGVLLIGLAVSSAHLSKSTWSRSVPPHESTPSQAASLDVAGLINP